uniref:R-phycoerythrin gamma chain, chloroplastic n=1 Tax=Corallina officinalis TaxID=35170 RepID=PHEG_COROI|nr:RecName: Full=R-phycoerythrin gamma chain, chloroplastic; Flags: Precursor [Corallina officinalis]AAO50083.1 R-phycoerythrin gamma subunit [Corallina officinalis]
MDSPAFAVTGMFAAAKVGVTSFTGATEPVSTRRRTSGNVTMAVDAFQKKFQTFGKIGVDYSRPKKLASYKRGGFDAASVEYPNAPSFAGKYSIAPCGQPSGASKILMKYDEYCAKGVLQVFKRNAVPFGVYTTKCTEGTVAGQAQEKRVFNRTMAFRQAQKPVNVRLAEQYEARRKCFILANGCSREEDQFKSMPVSAATFLAGKHESLGTCFRVVTPSNIAEDYIASGVRMQLVAKSNSTGVYGVGSCMEGFAKGDAEARRVAALAAEYRALQQSPAAVTGRQYESSRMAVKLYAQNCSHEQEQLYKWPATAAAFCRY